MVLPATVDDVGKETRGDNPDRVGGGIVGEIRDWY